MAKAVQDFNFFYWFFSPGVQYTTKCHYQNFVVKGKENLNLPEDACCIFAPCHQNALMDPLLVLVISKKSPVFLARADIFKKPVVAKFLNFLKIMPVYRIRDGKDSLSKNAEIFEKSKNVLLDGYPLCLMAEGRHNNQHTLLPLVKGMFRIAGETQKSLGKKPLYIIPTGIDYDEYERQYSNVVLNFGKPIPVQDFMEDYLENEPVGLNRMRDALAKGLIPQMHHISSEEHYSEIYTLSNALNPTMLKKNKLKSNTWNRFQMRRSISERLETMEKDGCEKIESIFLLARAYQEGCKELKLREKTPAEAWSLGKLLLLTLLVGGFILGCVWFKPLLWCLLAYIVIYPIPFLPLHLIPRKVIKDTQFRSSVNYGIRLVVSILYVIAATIVAGVKGGWIAALCFFVGAFVIARTSPFVINFLKGIGENWHFRFQQLLHKDKVDCLNKIIEEVSGSIEAEYGSR